MNYKLSIFFAALALLFIGCTNNDVETLHATSPNKNGNIVTVRANIGAPQTRVSFTQNTETQKLEARWADGDKIYLGYISEDTFTEITTPATIKNISADGKYAEFDIDLTGVPDGSQVVGSMLPFSIKDQNVGIAADNFFVPLDQLREVPRYFSATTDQVQDGEVTFINPGVTLLVDVTNTSDEAIDDQLFRIEENTENPFFSTFYNVQRVQGSDNIKARDMSSLGCAIPAGQTVTLAANVFPADGIPADIKILMGWDVNETATPTGINRSVEEPFAAGNAYRLPTLTCTGEEVEWHTIDPAKLIGKNWMVMSSKSVNGVSHCDDDFSHPIYVFNADNTGMIYFYHDESFTWQLNGNQLKITYVESDDFIGAPFTIPYTITLLTTDKLEWEYSSPNIVGCDHMHSTLVDVTNINYPAIFGRWKRIEPEWGKGHIFIFNPPAPEDQMGAGTYSSDGVPWSFRWSITGNKFVWEMGGVWYYNTILKLTDTEFEYKTNEDNIVHKLEKWPINIIGKWNITKVKYYEDNAWGDTVHYDDWVGIYFHFTDDSNVTINDEQRSYALIGSQLKIEDEPFSGLYTVVSISDNDMVLEFSDGYWGKHRFHFTLDTTP